MTAPGLITLVIYAVILLLLAKPVGDYLRRAYRGEPNLLGRLSGPLTRRLLCFGNRFGNGPTRPGLLPAEMTLLIALGIGAGGLWGGELWRQTSGGG